jgi:hypothetical protein
MPAGTVTIVPAGMRAVQVRCKCAHDSGSECLLPGCPASGPGPPRAGTRQKLTFKLFKHVTVEL